MSPIDPKLKAEILRRIEEVLDSEPLFVDLRRDERPIPPEAQDTFHQYELGELTITARSLKGFVEFSERKRLWGVL